MAQADTDVASRLRVAILSTQNFPRGVRRPSEFFYHALEFARFKTVIRNVLRGCLSKNHPVIFASKINLPLIYGD